MNEFKTYHPIVSFVYFAIVVTLSCVFMHPVCITVSFFFGFIYSVMLGGARRLKFNTAFIIPLISAAALINPAFNHRGATILSYLPNGNPLTLESIIFGIAAAGVLGSVILHFYCFSEIITSDKFIWLFGRIIPSLSLILSMVLSFIPKFKTQLRALNASQKCIGRDMTDGSVLKRVKNGARIMSAMLTWSLESSIDTADSMKSRGYGLPQRTSFSNFRFDARDKTTLTVILFLGLYIIIGSIRGAIYYRYFPSLKLADVSFYGISVLSAYLALCAAPVIIEVLEELKWRSLRQKI